MQPAKRILASKERQRKDPNRPSLEIDMSQDKPSTVKSVDSAEVSPAGPRIPGWIRIAAIAAASALAGGLAAAWFYRNTLRRLQDAENTTESSESYISHPGTEGEI